VDVADADCICKYGSIRPEDLEEDIAIIHPADSNKSGCWDRIRDLIKRTPSVRFYVFAFGRPERAEYIGEHPNLTYLTETNMNHGLNEIIDIAQGKVV
jgi:hypothetical protein